jgi:Terminase large subunit, T4likevirus-type, N-terminal
MNSLLETYPTSEIVREWKPFRRQKEFISLPFSIFEALYGGSAGGGKSDCIVLLPLLYQFHLHPRYKGIILRRTFPDLEQEIILRSHQWYPAAGGSYSEQKRRWTFPSGAVQAFGHAEHKEDIRKYDSSEYNLASFEELTHFIDFQYLYLIGSRVRSSSSDLPAIVRNSSTPGNIGHSFVRRRFVDPAPEGGKIILDPLKPKLKRIFVRSFPHDNPYLDPNYIHRLDALPEAEKQAKLGNWYVFQGQAFDNFRPEGPLPDEPENANHVVDDFKVPDYWPKIAAIDWGGGSAGTYSAIANISPDGKVFISDEMHYENAPISTWATEIGKCLEEKSSVVRLKLDSNAWNTLGEENTIAEQFYKYSKYRPEPADKGKGSRISGRILLQEFLRFAQKPARKVVRNDFDPELAEKILRFHGVRKYEEYLEFFKPEEPETNLPRLQIFRSCRKLIETIPLCVYDENNPSDVKAFDGDDPYDCLRYLLRSVDSYIRDSALKFEEVQKLAQIEKKLQESQDQTTFYRQMEFLEAKKKKGFGVVRFPARRV